MKKNKKIEELLDRWEEGNMSVKDLSDELYILFDVRKSSLNEKWNEGYNRGCEDTHVFYNNQM
jgi:hypothetical protein